MTEPKNVFDETWSARGRDVDGGEGRPIAQFTDGYNASPQRCAHVNARASLAAAAPELYRALNDIMLSLFERDPDSELLNRAEAALKRARGEHVMRFATPTAESKQDSTGSP